MISPSELFADLDSQLESEAQELLDLVDPDDFLKDLEDDDALPQLQDDDEDEDVGAGKFTKCKPEEMAMYNRNIAHNLVEGKKRKRKAVQKGKKKNLEMLEGKMIKHSESVCSKCTCSTSYCTYIKYPMIKSLRDDVYGEGSTRDTRTVWRHEYLSEVLEKTAVAKAKAGIAFDEKKLNYFLPARYTPDAKDLHICRRCMEEVTGFSCATWQDTRKKVVVDGVKVDLSSVGEEKKPKLNTSEWNCIVAWFEMHIHSLTCHSPEGRKQELQGGMTLALMYRQFNEDWAAGVMDGMYHRSNFGRMPKEKRLQTTAPTYRFFARVWAKEFNCNYKIPRAHKRFPMCNWCCQIKTFLEKAKTPEEKLHWRRELLGHFMFVEKCKDKYYSHREKAAKQKTK